MVPLISLFAGPARADVEADFAAAIQRSREVMHGPMHGPDAGIAELVLRSVRDAGWRASMIERIVDEFEHALVAEQFHHFQRMARVVLHAAMDGAALESTRELREAALVGAINRGWRDAASEIIDVIAWRGEVASLPVLERIPLERAGSGPMSSVAARTVRARELLGESGDGDDVDVLRAAAGMWSTDRRIGFDSPRWNARVDRAVVRSLAGEGLVGFEVLHRCTRTYGVHEEWTRALASSIADPDPRTAFRAAALLANVPIHEDPSDDTVDGLRRALAHADVWIRRHAFLRLASTDVTYGGLRERLSTDILARLVDEDPWVRSLAAFASASMGDGALAALDAAHAREIDPVARHWMQWASERLRRSQDWIVDVVLSAERLPRASSPARERWARGKLDSDVPGERLDAAIALLRSEPRTPERDDLGRVVDTGMRELVRDPETRGAFFFGGAPPDGSAQLFADSLPMVEFFLAESRRDVCYPGSNPHVCADLAACVSRLTGDATALHAAVSLHPRLHGGRALTTVVGRLGETTELLAPFLALDFAYTHLGDDGWQCGTVASGGGRGPEASWDRYFAAFGDHAVTVLLELERHPDGRVAAAARTHLGRFNGEEPR